MATISPYEVPPSDPPPPLEHDAPRHSLTRLNRRTKLLHLGMGLALAVMWVICYWRLGPVMARLFQTWHPLYVDVIANVVIGLAIIRFTYRSLSRSV